MKALILNSGIGSRMKNSTISKPKCLVEIDGKTILERQLDLLLQVGINEVIITTGYLSDEIENQCIKYKDKLNIVFVYNDLYDSTNYIYSIYKAKEYVKDTDLLFLHGDLVFSDKIIFDILKEENSCVAITSSFEANRKDFKARVLDSHVSEISVNIFDDVYQLYPIYKMNKNDWNIWLNSICEFCMGGGRCA